MLAERNRFDVNRRVAEVAKTARAHGLGCFLRGSDQWGVVPRTGASSVGTGVGGRFVREKSPVAGDHGEVGKERRDGENLKKRELRDERRGRI